ncbi:Protein cordon-bleu [Myotis davidii]|uniref:Protein cordon-bleu n=1 Tax=Myotis davidii TaxID=225400 RepID=L5MG12_MYODS|nr:Protein cordon-bleu [Myotis davidii]
MARGAGGGDGGAADVACVPALTPAVSLPLGPSGSCADGVPAVPAEAEETVSVSSCFASEDTTEDSGVMSSPSDIVSLDSQHDSTKSRDKWATDQEDGSDQDLAGTPELGPPKSPVWERSGLGHWHSRAERAAAAPGEDGGLLIAGQWEQTLAGLDEDLEGMDDSYETDSSSVTGSLSSASGRRLQGTIPDGDTDTIPVTFIGEVLDDPVEPGLFSNRNNNAGSFDQGSPAGRGSGAKQSPSDHSTSSAWDPSGSPDGPRSPPPRLVNGSRWAPEHGEPPASLRASSRDSHATPELEGRPGVLCTEICEADESPPPSIFGPKKKFRPVVQKPAPKDTSLHSALMEAIHSAGGRDGLRKTPEPSAERGPKKLSYVEPESEHSALLAAIRGHRGACSLRKVASCASEELRSFREAARSAHGPEPSGLGDPGSQPPATLPPPPPPAAPAPPPASRTAPRASASALGTPVDARQALMDAIRSGTGAARLRKVPLLV